MTQVRDGSLKEIHFVTGKGGVGKSTTAFVTARELASRGVKTLLVEIGDHSFYSFLLKQKIHYTPTPISNHLEVAHWSAQECLKGYAISLLKVEALYRLFFENPVTRSLIQVAPSLTELAITGQITSSPRNHGPHGDHEALVIDAFATGHFLQLIQAPLAMGETINRGPMGDQSRQIYEVFEKSGICQLHIVTTAEELPMTEAFELQSNVEALFDWPIQFILNRYIKSTLKHDRVLLLDKSKKQMALRDKILAQEESLERLKKSGTPLRVLPLMSVMQSWKELMPLESL